MIVKQHDKEIEVLQLEALNRRLSSHHPKKEEVQGDYKKKISEINGEKEVNYPLGFLNKQDYIILHNLRIADENGFFQIDTLILSEKYMLILEVKNWKGTIIFGENGQVIRALNNEEEGFSNPIPQAKMQQHRLQKWLYRNGIRKSQLDFLVVISFPSTVIKSSSPKIPIPNKVTHNNDLFFKIQDLERKYTSCLIKIDHLMKLANLLIEAHTPPTGNILDKYKLTKSDLIKGVFCPNCNAVPMGRFKQKWHCIQCNHNSVNAYLVALNDYKLLIGDRITNCDARDFLQINSPYTVKRLLMSASFDFGGNTKSRFYKL